MSAGCPGAASFTSSGVWCAEAPCRCVLCTRVAAWAATATRHSVSAMSSRFRAVLLSLLFVRRGFPRACTSGRENTGLRVEFQPICDELHGPAAQKNLRSGQCGLPRRSLKRPTHPPPQHSRLLLPGLRGGKNKHRAAAHHYGDHHNNDGLHGTYAGVADRFAAACRMLAEKKEFSGVR